MNSISQRRRASQGFSLAELMIALAAGLVVSSAVVAFLLSSFKSNGEYVQSTRLTQELRNSMDLITRDLRRAGYDGKSVSYLATGDVSPFSRIQLCNASNNCTLAATAPLTCVIYSYDRGSNWGQVDVDNGEVRGIRLSTPTINGRTVGVLEYAVSGGGVKPACNGASPDYTTYPVVCNAGSKWCPLSDGSRIDISSFAMTRPDITAGKVKLRDITLTMQGRLAGSSDFTRGVTSSVRVRTDCYETDPTRCIQSP